MLWFISFRYMTVGEKDSEKDHSSLFLFMCACLSHLHYPSTSVSYFLAFLPQPSPPSMLPPSSLPLLWLLFHRGILNSTGACTGIWQRITPTDQRHCVHHHCEQELEHTPVGWESSLWNHHPIQWTSWKSHHHSEGQWCWYHGVFVFLFFCFLHQFTGMHI